MSTLRPFSVLNLYYFILYVQTNSRGDPFCLQDSLTSPHGGSERSRRESTDYSWEFELEAFLKVGDMKLW